MPRRDRSAEAVAREWLGSNGPETVFVGDLASLIEFDRRAERARVRRIVRRELAKWEWEYAAGNTGSGITGRINTCTRILAALREGKGAKG